MYDYKAIAVFVAVVELRSMHRAAEKLKMTPSAVSQSIQKLEQQLQIKLLVRTTRKLALTEAGEAFFQHANTMVQSAENALKSIELIRSQPVGQLNIACPSGLSDSPLAGMFKSVLDAHPEFKLNLFFEDNLLDLADKRIDIALRAGEDVLDDSMIARHIFDFEWAIVAAPSYFQQQALPQNLDELANLDWINFLNERFTTLILHNGKEERQIYPRYRLNGNNLYACRRLTLQGLGVSIQPIDDVRQYIQRGELISLFHEWRRKPTPLYLITLQRVQSEKVRIAYELIVDFFEQLKKRGKD